MKEYKVEFTEIKKTYTSITIEAESRKDAIEKVRQSRLDSEAVDDHEISAQSQWVASSNRGFFDWVSSIFN